MQAAGLTPRLQFGEILWWFLANASGMAFYDADTQAAALATFHTPNDDPSINNYGDANFLRTRLYNYVAAIQSAVLAQYPSAVFELLWPMDVNDPDNCRLLRYINLPPQWTTRAGENPACLRPPDPSSSQIGSEIPYVRITGCRSAHLLIAIMRRGNCGHKFAVAPES